MADPAEDPPPAFAGLPAGEVLAVLDALAGAGFRRVWVGGGWGVDALVGKQTRRHRDVDLAVDITSADLGRAVAALAGRSYWVETDWLPTRVELAAPGERWVDLHPVVFDGFEVGWQANRAGLPPFTYPPDAFACGIIAGQGVRCLSAAQQLHFHTGYPPRPHDLHDLGLLHTLIGQD